VVPLPAICRTCGTVFSAGIDIGEGSLDNGFIGNRVRCPAPACDGWGEVPGGVYSFVDNTITVLLAQGYSPDDLERLARVFTRARDMVADPDAASATIQREAPELASIADVLPRTRPELYGFLTLVIAAITCLATLAATAHQIASDSMSPEEVERLGVRIVREALESSERAPPRRSHVSQRPPPPSPRRLDRERRAKKAKQRRAR
jgi:hypothetical protein